MLLSMQKSYDGLAQLEGKTGHEAFLPSVWPERPWLVAVGSNFVCVRRPKL